MNLFTEIETTCKTLSETRAALRRRHEARQRALRAADTEYSADLRRLQDRCAAARAALERLVEQARPEFIQPRQPKTREFHGIEVGFEKERDTLVLPPDDLLVARVEKMLPVQQAETLLDRSVRIIKVAFRKLPRDIHQKLGCNLVIGADKVVIRAKDDDIETLVQKSLGAGAPEGTAA
jgi:hypothetical protein